MPESADGPYVSVACICQSPLQEIGGQISIIRIMDRIQVVGMTPDMQPQPLQGLFLVILLRSGSLRETYKVKVEGRSPQGAILSTNETPLLFEGEDRGAAVIAPVALVVSEAGLYWFDVSLEGKPLTRIPLRVQYQRIQGFPFQGLGPGSAQSS